MGKSRISASRLGSAALFVYLLASCIHYHRRHTPDEIRQAIVDADILGATPEEAIRKLQAITFRDGRRLVVGEYNAERYLVEATLGDAMRTSIGLWSINVNVAFDMSRHVSGFEVEYSADSPP